MGDLGDSQRARSSRASKASAVIMRVRKVRNRLFPHPVSILFSLHTAKGNSISGSGAKQQKLSVPRSFDATTTSTSTWYFAYKEHGKLTISVGIRIFPYLPVTSVEIVDCVPRAAW